MWWKKRGGETEGQRQRYRDRQTENVYVQRSFNLLHQSASKRGVKRFLFITLLLLPPSPHPPFLKFFLPLSLRPFLTSPCLCSPLSPSGTPSLSVLYAAPLNPQSWPLHHKNNLYTTGALIWRSSHPSSVGVGVGG